MSKQDPHNEPELTPDDLRRYRAGLLDAAERHRVERLLLREPLYDEALDGFEALAQAGRPVNPALADLRQRLHRRVAQPTKERRLLPVWWAMAASVCLLIGVYFFLYQKPDASQNQARQHEPRPERAPVSPAPSAGPPPEIARQADPDQPRAKRSRQRPARFSAERIARNEAPPAGYPRADAATPSAAPTRPDSGMRDAVVIADSPQKEARSAAPNALMPQKAPLAARKLAPPAAGRALQGRIVDGQTGQPLAGVVVTLPDKRRGTVTDADGRFQLPDSLTAGTQLTAGILGFETKSFTPADLRAGDVALQPSVQSLNEVVVTGYGTQARKAITGAVTRTTSPASQPEEFRQFVRQHKKMPASATEAGISGTVRLRFRVRKDGRIGRIRVISGLGYGCDEEAVRLLREGPRWQPASRKSRPVAGWAEVTIPFP
ncbi:TonB family protein [Tellurirhabdus rosea]|uniref:TonB family protein n=1 Tax=Tellurirhabdus rosea TaxID=2674997 RepID=UPI00225C403D|nr:TonB family protein [Tellurirhabdus rosea]